jgi:hypothetical protein
LGFLSGPAGCPPELKTRREIPGFWQKCNESIRSIHYVAKGSPRTKLLDGGDISLSTGTKKPFGAYSDELKAGWRPSFFLEP